MRTTIVTIGNSKGIRIPKLVLEESGLTTEVNLLVKKGEIKIVPVAIEKNKARFNTEYVLSLSSLNDWDTPEEDKAWAALQ